MNKDRFVTSLVRIAFLSCVVAGAAFCGTITPCGTTPGTSNGVSTTSYHCATITGFGFNNITASVIAQDQTQGATGPYFLSDSAVLDVMLYTDGPIRPGSLFVFEEQLDSGGDPAISSTFMLTEAGVTYCDGSLCIGHPPISSLEASTVTIGEPIELTLSASYSGQGLGEISSADIQIGIRDSVGHGGPPGFVNIFAAPSAPEPSTLALLCIALALVSSRARGWIRFSR